MPLEPYAQELDSEAPVGTVVFYLGQFGNWGVDGSASFPFQPTPPGLMFKDDKWVPLYGQSLPKITYPELHEHLLEAGVITETGTSSTFTLPNAQGKSFLGLAAAGTGSTLGGTGGTINDAPTTHATHASGGAHTHDAHTTISRSSGGVNAPFNGPATHSSDGGHTHDAHTAHTSQQPPYYGCHVLIKARP